MQIFRSLLIVLCCFITFHASSQGDSLRQYYQRSLEAYKAGDYKTYLSYAIKFNEIHPSHPSMTYNLASAYSLNNNHLEAEGYLRRALSINAHLKYEDDADFESLKKDPSWEKIIDFRGDQIKEVNTGKLMNTIEGINHGETIEYIPGKDILIIGTVNKPAIYSYSIKSKLLTKLLPYSETSNFAFTAAYYDEETALLWFTSVAMPEVINYNEADKNKSQVIAIDLAGNIVKTFTFDGYQFQDIIKVKKELLLSDGLTNNIYRLSDEETLTQVYKLDSSAFNLQSMAYDDSSGMLYVADYIKGIFAIDIATGDYKLMKAPEKYMVLKGIDGLEYSDGNLYAIHNGVNPKRVVKYKINGNEILKYEVLEQNIYPSGEPTSATIVGNNFYYISNSPWDAYENHKYISEKAEPLEIRMILLD